MQRYNNFLNPPNFRRSFFFESLVPFVWYLLEVLGSHLRGHLLYIEASKSQRHLYSVLLVRVWDLDKEADKQLSNRQNLLTTQEPPDTSEDPLF